MNCDDNSPLIRRALWTLWLLSTTNWLNLILNWKRSLPDFKLIGKVYWKGSISHSY